VLGSNLILWLLSSTLINEMNWIIIRLLYAVGAVSVAIVGRLFIPYPTLLVFPLTPYFFINNENIKRYIGILNLRWYRIFSMISYRFIEII
jgi:hypothetical protein